MVDSHLLIVKFLLINDLFSFVSKYLLRIIESSHTDEPSWPHFSTNQPTQHPSSQGKEPHLFHPPNFFYPRPQKQRLSSGRNRRDEAKIQDHVAPNWAAQRGWMGGGLLNIFGIFTPIPAKMIQFDEHIFQMGWNHQLDGLGAGFGALIFESFPVSLLFCETADGFLKSGCSTHLRCYKCLKIMGEATKLNWFVGF